MWGDRSRLAWFLSTCFALLACGDDSAVPDADVGPGDAAPDATSSLVTPPAFASMAPCPANWVEETSDDGVTTCAPWVRGGAMECGVDEAHFPGETGCTMVGPVCPAGDFPEDLPAGGRVFYVLAGATGGDGSMSRPYARISDAMSRASAGTTIAVGKGVYSEEVSVRSDVTVLGACVAETVVSSASSNTAAGVFTATGTGGVVRNLRVGTSSRPAVFVGAGTSLTVENVVVDDAEFVGMLVYGGALDATSVVVRNMRSRALNGQGGSPLVVLDGTGAARRVVFEHNRDIGIIIDGAEAALTLEDAVLRDLAPRDDNDTAGRGVEVASGATAVLRRMLIEDVREVGVWVQLGGAAELEQIVVRGTAVRASDGYTGHGMVVDEASSFTAQKTLFEGNIGAGVIVMRSTTTFEDMIVRDTLSEENDGLYGRGLVLQYAAVADITRLALVGNHDVALFAGGAGTDVRVQDLVVLDTLSREADGLGGRGVEVIDDGVVSLTRALVRANRELAVGATYMGAVLTLTDTAIEGTLPRDCAPDCPEAGFGLGAYYGGRVEATRFRVAGSNACGVHVAEDGQMDLHQGEIRDNPVGACLQVDGYDETRLDDDVAYEDNETNLTATTLPVPDPSGVAGFDG